MSITLQPVDDALLDTLTPQGREYIELRGSKFNEKYVCITENKRLSTKRYTTLVEKDYLLLRRIKQAAYLYYWDDNKKRLGVYDRCEIYVCEFSVLALGQVQVIDELKRQTYAFNLLKGKNPQYGYAGGCFWYDAYSLQEYLKRGIAFCPKKAEAIQALQVYID